MLEISPNYIWSLDHSFLGEMYGVVVMWQLLCTATSDGTSEIKCFLFKYFHIWGVVRDAWAVWGGFSEQVTGKNTQNHERQRKRKLVSASASFASLQKSLLERVWFIYFYYFCIYSSACPQINVCGVPGQ